jgi:hypothetical protein
MHASSPGTSITTAVASADLPGQLGYRAGVFIESPFSIEAAGLDHVVPIVVKYFLPSTVLRLRCG